MQVAHQAFYFIWLLKNIFLAVVSVVMYFAQLCSCFLLLFLTNYQASKNIIQFQFLFFYLFLVVS